MYIHTIDTWNVIQYTTYRYCILCTCICSVCGGGGQNKALEYVLPVTCYHGYHATGSLFEIRYVLLHARPSDVSVIYTGRLFFAYQNISISQKSLVLFTARWENSTRVPGTSTPKNHVTQYPMMRSWLAEGNPRNLHSQARISSLMHAAVLQRSQTTGKYRYQVPGTHNTNTSDVTRFVSPSEPSSKSASTRYQII